MPDHGPTARHRRLATELRSRRESADLTPEQAAAAVGWSRTKLVRLETAVHRPRPTDVEQLLDIYGAPSAIRAALVQLARDVRTRGWWAAYDDVLAGSYAELEDAASHLRGWQAEVPPGLLQTPEYARALISGEFPDDAAEVERRVQVRMTRRARLARADRPALDVTLAEEVLRRPVGGPAVMAGQLRALLDEIDRGATIRVVPISLGYRPVLGQGSIILFGFASPIELDTAWVETIGGEMYIEDVAAVRRCSVTLDRIAEAALSAERSAELIGAVIEEFQSHGDAADE